MPSGTVKWFDETLECGLIEPSDGGHAVLVHVTALKRAGLTSLRAGMAVNYDLVNRLGKPVAENLMISQIRD